MTSSTLRVRVVGVTAGLVLAGCAGGTSTGGPQTLPVLSSGGGGAAAVPAIAYPQPGRVEYRLGPSLPAVPDHASGYRLLADTPSDRVSQVAAAFGVGGSVTSGPSGWVVSDGRHVLRVARSGGLPWNLSDTAGTGRGVVGCAVASPGISTSPEPSSGPDSTAASPPPPPPVTCPPPTTAPGLPQKELAVTVARAALGRAGYDLGGATVDVSGGYDRWEVTVTPALRGVPVAGSPLSLSVGPDGIEAGSGWMAEPEPSTDYQLVGVQEGVHRLQEGGRWLLYGGPGPRPMMGLAEPPLTVRTIVGVRLALSWASPADPSITGAWLLPVYVFELDAGDKIPGGTLPVLAIADRYLPASPATVPKVSPPTAVVPPGIPVPAPPG